MTVAPEPPVADMGAEVAVAVAVAEAETGTEDRP